MAIVDVSEYTSLALDGRNQVVQTGAEPALAYQQVAIAAGSTQSTAFGTATRVVRIHTDAIVRILFGVNPTAAAGTSMRLAAGSTEYFGVIPGQKVATITST